MTQFLAVLKFIGWRGALALIFLATALAQMRALDSANYQVEVQKGAVTILAARNDLQRRELETATAGAEQCKTNLQALAANGSAWSNTVNTVNGYLQSCQAENGRLAQAAHQAKTKMRAAEAKAARDMSTAAERFNAASPDCMAARKEMALKCTVP